MRLVRIDGVNCGYTSKGNPYKKSSIGKNLGTVAGLALLYPATKFSLKRQGITFSHLTDLTKKFIKSGPSVGDYIAFS